MSSNSFLDRNKDDINVRPKLAEKQPLNSIFNPFLQTGSMKMAKVT